MSGVLFVRCLLFAATFSLLVLLDVSLVPVKESDPYVPRPTDAIRAAKERKDRIRKQKSTSAMQAVEVERALYQLDGVLEGIRLNPKDQVINNRLEKLRSKVGDRATDFGSSSTSSQ